VATAGLLLLAAVIPLPAAGAAPQTRTVAVRARQFAYEPGVIRVNRGDTLTVELESMDATHGLFIDGYGVNIDAEPGRSGQATFVADRPGSFKLRCSVSCGALHPFMIGEMVVEPNLPFTRALLLTLVAAAGAVAYFWKA
jgi:heme/copper-type cytochrome/quinol oxidase subunit 2